jgi:hypothetical protein
LRSWSGDINLSLKLSPFGNQKFRGSLLIITWLDRTRTEKGYAKDHSKILSGLPIEQPFEGYSGTVPTGLIYGYPSSDPSGTTLGFPRKDYFGVTLGGSTYPQFCSVISNRFIYNQEIIWVIFIVHVYEKSLLIEVLLIKSEMPVSRPNEVLFSSSDLQRKA